MTNIELLEQHMAKSFAGRQPVEIDDRNKIHITLHNSETIYSFLRYMVHKNKPRCKKLIASMLDSIDSSLFYNIYASNYSRYYFASILSEENIEKLIEYFKHSVYEPNKSLVVITDTEMIVFFVFALEVLCVDLSDRTDFVNIFAYHLQQADNHDFHFFHHLYINAFKDMPYANKKIGNILTSAIILNKL